MTSFGHPSPQNKAKMQNILQNGEKNLQTKQLSVVFFNSIKIA